MPLGRVIVLTFRQTYNPKPFFADIALQLLIEVPNPQEKGEDKEETAH